MQNRVGFAWLCTALLFVVGTAIAAEPAKPMRVSLEAELFLDQEGRVSNITFEEGTPPALASLAETTVKQWRFEPILRDGKPVAARTGMELDLEGTPSGSGWRMRVTKVLFASSRAKPERYVLPRMPQEAMRMDTSISVLAALRVDGKGDVVDVAVLSMEFSNKTRNMRLRKVMNEGLVYALKRSKFRPADVANAESTDETFFVPIDYKTAASVDMGDPRTRWRNATPVPWLDADHQPKLFDLPESRDGQPVAIANADVKLRTDVVGTAL